jgi:tetratricopeptide (TPR) repeat protein
VDETSAAREDLLYAYRTRGEFLSMTGEGEAAEQSLARALELAETDQDRVAVLARIGDNCQKLSRYADARSRYDAALALTGDAVGRADLLVSVVYLDYLQGRYAEAMARLDLVRALLDSASPSPEVRHVWAAYHKRTGDIRQELGSSEEALTHYATSLGLYRDLGDRIGESAVVNNMSSCYSAMGELEKSLELLHEAARMNAQIDDALGLAIAHYNLAETYGSLNEVTLAREYYERYMQANARIGNDLGIGYGHFGLGYLAWLENDLPSAERSYRAAADVFQRLETAQLAAMARIRLAEILIEQGNLAEGAAEVTRVRASTMPADDEQEVEVCYLEGLLAIASRGEGDGGSASCAVELLTDALQHTKPANIHGIMKCAYHLARTLERSGQRDRARETLAHALRTLRRHLERLGNHRYQESLLQAREVRRVRTAYEQLTGVRWDAYDAGGEA